MAAFLFCRGLREGRGVELSGAGSPGAGGGSERGKEEAGLIQWTAEIEVGEALSAEALQASLREAGFIRVEAPPGRVWLKGDDGWCGWPQVREGRIVIPSRPRGLWPPSLIDWLTHRYAGCVYRQYDKDGDLLQEGRLNMADLH